MKILFAAVALALFCQSSISKTNDIQCLATNIYFESRGEPVEGQYAVAHVVLNRVLAKGFPSTICEVVYEPRQFSWVRKRKNVIPVAKTEAERIALAKAYAISAMTLVGQRNDPTDGALYFHSTRIAPGWKRLKHTVTIGNHKFYKV